MAEGGTVVSGMAKIGRSRFTVTGISSRLIHHGRARMRVFPSSPIWGVRRGVFGSIGLASRVRLSRRVRDTASRRPHQCHPLGWWPRSSPVAAQRGVEDAGLEVDHQPRDHGSRRPAPAGLHSRRAAARSVPNSDGPVEPRWDVPSAARPPSRGGTRFFRHTVPGGPHLHQARRPASSYPAEPYGSCHDTPYAGSVGGPEGGTNLVRACPRA